MRNKLAAEIEAFIEVARHLSFKAAAEQLNMSPSALSRRIQKIEEALDVRLLDRTTRDVRLTLPGKQFLARSQQIMADVDELVTAIKGQGQARASSVKIAVIPSIACQILPGVLREFSETHPTTRVLVRDFTTNEVVEAVSRGDADFGVTSFVQPSAHLAFSPLVNGSFVLAAPKDHPLGQRKRVKWADLAAHRVISTWKGSGVRLVMDFDLAKAASRIEAFYEVQQVYTALRFVEAGLGVAPVPDHFLGPRERRRLSVAPLIDPVVKIDLGVVSSGDHPMRQQARAIYELLMKAARGGQDARGRNVVRQAV